MPSLLLLGAARLLDDQGRPVRLPYDKVLALAVLCALEPAPWPRERLADLLWPASPPGQARTNLRRCVHDLRHALQAIGAEADLQVDKKAIALRTTGAHWQVDASRLAMQLADLMARDQHAPPDAFDKLLSAYAGPLLQGFEPTGAPGFEAWARARRDSLQRDVLHGLQRCAELHARQGQREAAMRALRRGLGIDPRAEPLLRQLMRLLADDDVAPALQLFEQFEASLRRETGQQPQPSTLALAAALRQPQAATIAVEVPAPAAVSREDRRRLVVLACDVEPGGDDIEASAPAARAALQACAMLIRSHGGHLLQADAGELLACFGHPRADEHAARRALETAAALSRAPIAGLRCRVGLHAGWALAAAEPDGSVPDALGSLRKLARRLAQAAQPGDVRVSAAMLFAAARHHRFGPLDGDGARLLGPAPAAPPRQPLAGRDAELSSLMADWTLARVGRPRGVLVRGEPGIGKSRLLGALGAMVRAQGLPVLRLAFLPETSHLPHQPFVAFARRHLQTDGPLSALEAAVDALLEAAGLTEPWAQAALLRLLGSRSPASIEPPDAAGSPNDESRLLCCLLEAMGQGRPQLLLLEDLHWADASSLALLAWWLTHASAPALLLISSREAAPAALEPLLSAQLPLQPLPDEAMQRLLSGLGVQDAAQRKTVLERADGIPLYAVELVRALHEQPGEPIPTSLWDLLAARLEQAGPAQFRAAQVASAIGLVFDHELLAAVLPPVGADAGLLLPLELLLQRLVQQGVLRSEGPGRHRFRHALLRDAAYQSLSAADRRLLHRALADALLGPLATRGLQEPGLLARQLSAAGDPVAAHYWLMAGRRAAAQSARAEARHAFVQGLQALQPVPPGDLAHRRLALPLQLALGTVLQALNGYGCPEAARCFRAALHLAEAGGGNAGDPSVVPALSDERFQALWGLWLGGHGTGAGPAPAAGLPADRLAAASRWPTHGAQAVQVSYAMGHHHFLAGELTSAAGWLRQTIAHAAHVDPQWRTARYGEDSGITARALLSWVLAWQGEVRAARATSAVNLEEAARLGHASNLATALAGAAGLHRRLREPALAEAQARRLLALAEPEGLALWQAGASGLIGWAMCQQGRPGGGPLLQQAAQAVARAMPAMEASFLLLWAEGLLASGQAADAAQALPLLDTAAQRAALLQQHGLQAELARLRGEALRACGAPAARIDEAFGLAMLAATTAGAPMLQLRTACSRWRWLQAPASRPLVLAADLESQLAETEGWMHSALARIDAEPGLPDIADAQALLRSGAARAAEHD